MAMTTSSISSVLIRKPRDRARSRISRRATSHPWFTAVMS